MCTTCRALTRLDSLEVPWCLKLEFSKLDHACAIIRNLINAPAEALDYKKYTCIVVL